MLPPVDTFIYVQWTEDGNELPGWYKAQFNQYYADGSCKIVYFVDDNSTVFETVNLNTVAAPVRHIYI